MESVGQTQIFFVMIPSSKFSTAVTARVYKINPRSSLCRPAEAVSLSSGNPGSGHVLLSISLVSNLHFPRNGERNNISVQLLGPVQKEIVISLYYFSFF